MLDRWFIGVVVAGAVLYVVARFRRDARRYKKMQQTKSELRELRLHQVDPYQWPDLGDDVLNEIMAITDAAPDGISTGLIVDGRVIPIRRTRPPQERGR